MPFATLTTWTSTLQSVLPRCADASRGNETTSLPLSALGESNQDVSEWTSQTISFFVPSQQMPKCFLTTRGHNHHICRTYLQRRTCCNSLLIFLLMAIVISLEKEPHSFLGFKIQINKFELGSLSNFVTAFLQARKPQFRVRLPSKFGHDSQPGPSLKNIEVYSFESGLVTSSETRARPKFKKHFTYPAQSSPTKAWASKLSGVAQTRNREQGVLSSNNLHFVGAWFANKHTCDNSLNKRTTPWK